MTDTELSIVYPAYNEADSIEAALQAAVDYVDDRELAAEIIVVNDGSTDETERLAREIAELEDRVQLLSHHPNRGKGYAVKRGMLAASGEWRLFLDVDLATPVHYIDDALALLREGADVVIGSRHLPASQIQAGHGFLRTFMSAAFRRIASGLLRLGVSDITCGFKAMRVDVAEEIFGVQQEYGWAFDAELIYIARKWELDLREMPVRWMHSGGSQVRVLPAAWQSFNSLLRVRQHDRRGKYARPQQAMGR